MTGGERGEESGTESERRGSLCWKLIDQSIFELLPLSIFAFRVLESHSISPPLSPSARVYKSSIRFRDM